MASAARVRTGPVWKTRADGFSYDLDMSDKLASGETLTGVDAGYPTVTPSGGNHLQVTAVVSGVLCQIGLVKDTGESEEVFTADDSTDAITITGHHFADGDEVWLEGDDLPAPLKVSRTYYVRDKTTDTFKLTDLKDPDGDLGPAINLTSDGEGIIGHYYVVRVRCSTSEGSNVVGEDVVGLRG